MAQSFDDLLTAMPDIAKAVNEFSNEAAQQRALDALLDAFFGREFEVPASADPASTQTSGGGQGEGGEVPPPADETRAAWEKRLLEGMPGADVVAEKAANRDHQAMWAVLTLWSRGQPPTTTAIVGVIRSELGLSPERANHLSNRLKDWTPKYVSRKREGSSYVYLPTARALEVFQGASE